MGALVRSASLFVLVDKSFSIFYGGTAIIQVLEVVNFLNMAKGTGMRKEKKKPKKDKVVKK